MSFNNIQQLQQLLKDKRNILISFGKDASGDTIASALALFAFLKKNNKPTDIICDQFVLPQNFKFLNHSDQIQNKFSYFQKLIITLDTEQGGIQELSYDVKDKKLRIFITPKEGVLDKENIRATQSEHKHDLIFILGTPDLASLGEIHQNNVQYFNRTPIINIDNKSSNEHFGHLNFVDLTAASVAEVLHNILQKIGEEHIDEQIATALLTGLIHETKSFKSANVKPDTLAAASKLISLGADREKIVNNLYCTKTLSTLKLWGTALSHLQQNKDIGLVWTTITRDDFTRCGATEADLYGIMHELINTSPDAKLSLLMHEHTDATNQNFIHCLLNTNSNHDVMKMTQTYSSKGSIKNVSFKITGKTLKEAEEELITHLKKQL